MRKISGVRNQVTTGGPHGIIAMAVAAPLSTFCVERTLMMLHLSSSLFGDVAPSFNRGPGGFLLVGGIAMLASFGLFMFFLIRRISRPAPRIFSQVDALTEDLSEYPPPPVPVGNRRLLVRNVPARLRLVVVAPLGRNPAPNPSQAEKLLDRVMHGLSETANSDKPRITIWPSQLNQGGFPTFFRMVQRPDDEHEASRWVLIAGPATASGQKFLLGLALCTAEATHLGNINVEPHQWNEVLDLR
jgi:hypothetical protein